MDKRINVHNHIIFVKPSFIEKYQYKLHYKYNVGARFITKIGNKSLEYNLINYLNFDRLAIVKVLQKDDRYTFYQNFDMFNSNISFKYWLSIKVFTGAILILKKFFNTYIKLQWRFKFTFAYFLSMLMVDQKHVC